ncbi:MAG: hypothetical protein P8Z73_16680 [Desulfobacteraceae bacterium]
MADNQVEHRIAQKLQALIIAQVCVGLLIDIGAVAQRLLQQAQVVEVVAQSTL